MNAIQYNLSRALQVLTRDLKIRAFLEKHDPKALEQANDALTAEYIEWEKENSQYYSEERKVSKQAFENAVRRGRFIAEPPKNGWSEHNHVDNFMYLYSNNTHDFFKHIDTCEYVIVAKPN